MDKLYQIRNGKAEPVNFSWVPGTGPGGSGISDAVGAIRLYNRNNIPDNARVHATNRMYSKAEYPELYAVIGDKYPEYIENKTFKNPVVEDGNVPEPWKITASRFIEGSEPWRIWGAGNTSTTKTDGWIVPSDSGQNWLNIDFGGQAFYITQIGFASADSTMNATVTFTYDDGTKEVAFTIGSPGYGSSSGYKVLFNKVSAKPVISVRWVFAAMSRKLSVGRLKFSFATLGNPTDYFGVPGAPLLTAEESSLQPDQITCIIVKPGSTPEVATTFHTADDEINGSMK